MTRVSVIGRSHRPRHGGYYSPYSYGNDFVVGVGGLSVGLGNYSYPSSYWGYGYPSWGYSPYYGYGGYRSYYGGGYYGGYRGGYHGGRHR